MEKPVRAPQDAAVAPVRLNVLTPPPGGRVDRDGPRHSAATMHMEAGFLTRQPAPSAGDEAERRQPMANGRGSRALDISPGSYDAENRTVEVVLSAGSPVRRFYFTEELEISAEAIDLARVTGGICPLLDTHNQYELDAVIGRVLSARIEGGQLLGVVQFADNERGREVEARVASGELRAISIGYRVSRWEITARDDNDHETWRAVAWELLEASLVPVPADPNAVVRADIGTMQHGTTTEDEDMRRNLPGGAAAAAPSPAAPVAEAPAPAATIENRSDIAAAPAAPAPAAVRGVTAARIIEQCGRSEDLGNDFALELIADNERSPLTEGDLLQRVNDRLIAARAQPSIDIRAGRSGTESEGYRNAVEDALLLAANPGFNPEAFGITPQRAEAATEFRGLTMMEMSRDYLQRTGISMRNMGRLEVAGAAMGMRGGALTTSDFAYALGNAANRRVRAAYQAAPQTFRQWASTGTLPDFRPANIIAMGDAPALLLVAENGEIKHGAMSDSGESYKLATYARIIPISRQAIINDDKNLFGRIPTQFANKAADLESDLVYSQITGNPLMSDGVPLFHASHGNLGTAAAIDVTSVAAGRLAMSQQKTPDGNFMTIRPKYLIVGPEQETAAEIFLTAVAAVQTSNVNPFPGKLTLIVDQRILGKQWFLAADPNAYDTVLLAHLEGQEGVFTDTHQSFEVDGIKFKARLDATAKAIDFRGLFRNPGQ